MERRDVAGSPTIKIKVDEALASDIDADHMIQFDVLFDDGMFGSPIDIYGTKNAGKSKYTFASIENGAIKDGNGTVVYGDKDTDKDGWITVSILIAEQNRTYDIYVDGVKQTNGAAMPSVDSYPAWTSYKPYNYCIGVRNQGNADTFFFMDNLCMKNGNETTLGIYKGEDSLGVYYTSVPSYENKVDLTKQGILDFIGTANSMLNVSPFGSSKLLLANALTLTKIGSDDGMDVLEDLMIDYGAETGAYTDGAISIFENGNAYIKAWLEVDPEDEDYAVYNVATKGYIVYDNDKTDAVEPVEGTYTVTGGIITVEWVGDAPVFGTAAVTYLKYDAATSTVSIYADAAAATKVEGADFILYKATEAYAYTYYANIGEGDKYTLRIDPFLGIASLKVVGADGTTEGEYPYTVDGSTVTVNSLAFNYNEEDNTFTVGETVYTCVVRVRASW
ncbi:MAG: hypothetical protein J6T24_05325 [Clostridia bacterium]|nr:hypothetical protein [Clostridia bacterium]